MREESLFIIFKNLTIFFATIMLLKYYAFLLISPFHDLKELLRKKKLAINSDKNNYKPMISVIVPARNEEIGIIKTIKSVVNNDYDKFEVIVVNDGSVDSTHDKIVEYLKQVDSKHHNIKYFSKENGGKGTALNHGINEAKGEIILTIDADSILKKDALSKLVPYFEDKKIDAAVGQVRIATNPTLIGLLQQLEYAFGFYFKRAHSVLNAEYIFGGACAAFRNEKIFKQIGYFETASKTEDIEMSLRTRFHGLTAVYAEDVICYTEGASTLKGLIDQRLRWKKGRFDTFIKYRSMFFSTDKKHNIFLSWFILPYAILSELQLLFEPIGVTLLVSYSIISGDYISLAIGIMFIFIIYMMVALFSRQKGQLILILLFPFTWFLFYFLMWVEYICLMQSLRLLIKGEEVAWQNWDRKGVENEI